MNGKLYFIVGCTACGKGSLGRHLAGLIGGQIVSVDSMKVYRRMNIGTAKPTPQAQAAATHHCIDIVEPNESFSVAQYVEHADRAIKTIRADGAIPLAVGGTSLYIKALSEGLFEGPSADPEVRAELIAQAQSQGPGPLHAELAAIDPESALRIHPNDTRRIVRGLEVFRSCGKSLTELQKQWDSGEKRYDCVFIGLRRDKPDQSGRINTRVRRMVADGLADEVRSLLDEPQPLSPTAAQAVGYAELIEHFKGNCTLDEAIEQVKINTRRLAKKQRTWHRRFAGIQWFDLEPDATVEETARIIVEKIDFN
ncbi:MAG: tRNA (adenosine(37)-N6)-dimethylallyltransferase MiaA [Phycisphaerales bacterium]|jgi:tRNA dimethylallyltransferase|nr:tRNA (adenosine(37)-N6)-dimethylallyltransferase MiaA [Phycisphaerales bacterium]